MTTVQEPRAGERPTEARRQKVCRIMVVVVDLTAVDGDVAKFHMRKIQAVGGSHTVVLRVVTVDDVTQPRYRDTGGTGRNAAGTGAGGDAENVAPAAKANRVWKLGLTDGRQQIMAMERAKLQHLDQLKVGSIIRLQDAVVERGMVVLTVQSCKLL